MIARIVLLAEIEIRERLVRRLRRAEHEALREAEHVERSQHDAQHRERAHHERQLAPARCACHDARNAPSSTRNSPVNPLVVGNPTDASVRIMKNTE